jgi:hypothetical protein
MSRKGIGLIKFNFKRAGPPVLSRVGGRKPERVFEPCKKSERKLSLQQPGCKSWWLV